MTENIKETFSKNKSGLIFMLKMVGFYGSLLGIYEWYISPYSNIDYLLIQQIISQGEWVLQGLSYETITPSEMEPNLMGIINTSGVIIGGPCDGLTLFILYSTFILAFNGKWWMKIIFLVLGIVIIHFLNVLRVVALAVIVKNAPDHLDFHHSYTFTLFVYGVVFTLWMLRIKTYQWIKK